MGCSKIEYPSIGYRCVIGMDVAIVHEIMQVVFPGAEIPPPVTCLILKGRIICLLNVKIPDPTVIGCCQHQAVKIGLNTVGMGPCSDTIMQPTGFITEIKV